MDVAGRLYIIGTPIGNLADMTPRGVETLRSLDVLYCEDTRVTAKLISHLGISIPTRALSDDFGPGRIDEALGAVQSGKRVGFASDAGMPGISDPARRLTEAAWRAGVVPQVIPGVSALSTALAACPFIENGFRFAGFPPRKPGERTQFVVAAAESPEPIVFFESPRRVHTILDELCATLEPRRRVLIARELTKLHEQLVLFEADEWAAVKTTILELGEFTVVIEGRAEVPEDLDADAARKSLERLKAAGFTTRDAARALAAVLDVGVNVVKKLDY